MNKTHMLRHDHRVTSLQSVLIGLEKSIKELEEKMDYIEWYDFLWLKEEAEPIIGLSFVALQTYINSSIYDRHKTLKHKTEKYKLGNLIEGKNRTDIESIIGVANYFKHRDDNRDLHKGTQEILKDLDLFFEKEIDIEKSPIINRLEFFSKKGKLTDMIKIVADWREKLWLE